MPGRSGEVLSLGYLSAPSVHAAIVYLKAVVGVVGGVGCLKAVVDGPRGWGSGGSVSWGLWVRGCGKWGSWGCRVGQKGARQMHDHDHGWQASLTFPPLQPAYRPSNTSPAGHPHAHGLEQGGHPREPGHHALHHLCAAALAWRVGALACMGSVTADAWASGPGTHEPRPFAMHPL